MPKSSTAGLTVVYAYHTDAKTIGTSTITSSEYKTDYTKLSSYQNGKSWFLKYEIDSSNVIQKNYACVKFDFISEPVCVQGAINETSLTNKFVYNANKAALTSLQSTFNSNLGSCGIWLLFSYFSVDDLKVNVSASGVDAYDSDVGGECNVSKTGKSNCGSRRFIILIF